MEKVLICSFKDTLQSIIKFRCLKLETISKGTLVPEDLDFYKPLNSERQELRPPKPIPRHFRSGISAFACDGGFGSLLTARPERPAMSVGTVDAPRHAGLVASFTLYPLMFEVLEMVNLQFCIICPLHFLGVSQRPSPLGVAGGLPHAGNSCFSLLMRDENITGEGAFSSDRGAS